MVIDVINFNFEHDDGKILDHFEDCDCIILGPSRVGKTPLCFYLGYFGIKALNIPLVPEINLNIYKELPRRKCFGLIRSVESLKKFRSTREKYLGISSNYATESRIFKELEYANNIYESIRCPIIDLDNYSNEEAAEFIKDRINFKEE
ncbi:kinase/pyrophosphorylase [Ezakiella peruensis]|uniref:kinase/pyrophosphorylase n=1 Tax=Ezakiella peruensis TaxID=1464038 RepID=UPI000C1B1875|nr:kinase/pyrophosphorylase [Ezakiella peruensis]